MPDLRRPAVIAQVACALIWASTCSTVLAADNQTIVPFPDQIDALEEVVYGQVSPSAGLSTRLDHLEITAFGKTSTGSFAQRIQTLKAALNANATPSAAGGASTNGASNAAGSNSAASSGAGLDAAPANTAASNGAGLDAAPANSAASNGAGLDAAPANTAASNGAGLDAAPANSAASSGARLDAAPANSAASNASTESVNQISTQASANSTAGDGGLSQEKLMLRAGIAAENSGDDQTALTDFNQVLAADSRNADAYFNIAAIEEKNGQLQDAFNNYSKVLAIKPDDADSQQALDSVRRRLGFNRSVPAPFWPARPLDVGTARGATVSVTDPSGPVRTVQMPSPVMAPMSPPPAPLTAITAKKGFHVGRFLHEVSKVAVGSVVAAGVVLNSTNITVGTPPPGVDLCACH